MAVAHPIRTTRGVRLRSDSQAAADSACADREGNGLLLVGLFKMSKAVFFFAVGVGALHLIHRNLGDVLMRIIEMLPIDPEGRIVSVVMDKADLINGHDLRRIGAGAFIYSTLCVIEGTGLLMRKTWAEYFTVILTVLGLPLEFFELVRRFTLFRVGSLLTNLVILAYLLFILKRRQREDLQYRLPSNP